MDEEGAEHGAAEEEEETDIWISGRRKKGMRHGMKLIPREGEESSAGIGGGGGDSGSARRSGGKKPFGDLGRGPPPRRSNDLVCPLAAATSISAAAPAAVATNAAIIVVDGVGGVTVNGVLLGRPDRRKNGPGGMGADGSDDEREEE